MKQKQVHRHIHDEVHYTFENNTLALQQVDVQKKRIMETCARKSMSTTN